MKIFLHRDRAGVEKALAIVTIVLKHGGEPTPEDLSRLGWFIARGTCTMELLEACFLRAIESARNPFVPGIRLSVVLSDAIRGAQEGSQRTFVVLQEGVDGLLLKILEGLPQTVRKFPHGMAGCRSLFEPETTGELPQGFEGPLRSLVENEEQLRKFCVSPLVMNYLSRSFTRGLPNLRDTQRAIGDAEGLSYLRSEGLVVDSNLTCDVCHGQKLQGTGGGRLTYLRGAQFVIAGVVAKPANYYRVPSLRMGWDLVVYIVLLVLFDKFVLMYPNKPLTWGEVGLGVYIMVSLDFGR